MITNLNNTAFAFDSRAEYSYLWAHESKGGLAIKTACTYAIENTATGAAYGGSTGDFFIRWRKHLNHLRNENHSCARLQAEFDADGESEFVIRILKVYPDAATAHDHEEADCRELYAPDLIMNGMLGHTWVAWPGHGKGRRGDHKPAKSTLMKRVRAAEAACTVQ